MANFRKTVVTNTGISAINNVLASKQNFKALRPEMEHIPELKI